MSFIKSFVSAIKSIHYSGWSGEEDAKIQKKKVVDIFDADKTVGDIVYRKEFLILDHKIKGSIMFTGRFLAYKDLVLTDKGIYIVGVPSIEHYDYKVISSITLDNICIELVINSKIFYLYATELPAMGSAAAVAVRGLRIEKELKDDFSKIKTLLEAHGLRQ